MAEKKPTPTPLPLNGSGIENKAAEAFGAAKGK